jgi:tryptophan-rich sensory protein
VGAAILLVLAAISGFVVWAFATGQSSFLLVLGCVLLALDLAVTWLFLFTD